ncbi:16S rRNA (cytosine(967)-C(5))-methyltransferase RsmB [Solirubrobacter ginsenosidimutans]|uniref:16S rRNA (cytosine(967)-C(5))-methyltransferase n=1 Tax=Solirubrobacter ginsenosidimutans TaxID=490573 RepID=A0A9X3MZZ0_9ACTN|nr:16S rRNA (cytosine(967)-C(5))-methyltransferase RsmB [Solirubrobacter ginsenosidimutans]MDA0166146.1 16S rRNA (cytosine(967)-C(5))-methyltransferase RsmB [Solirubrobacter ginsenosidimutans]
MQNLDLPSGLGPIAPARACAYAVVRRVFEQDAWADRALHGEAKRLRLDARDLALATQLSYGTVQRMATLDHVIERLARRSSKKLDAPVLAALRLGVFQLTFLDRVPAHAAVGESVELAKRDAPRGAGLVNAVLRRAAREGRKIVAQLPDRTAEQAALRHSHPEWIARLWFDAFGAETARALMAADNEPAEPSLRANTLKTTAEELALRLPAHVVDEEALILDGPFDTFGAPEWEQGLLMPQSRAAMAVARALAPTQGERVLDLCAAPGGKTTHLAALMGDVGEIVAVEKHPGRAEALRATAERMGATIVDVRTADATHPLEPTFDRVLVDPPCSDLGTLASRPDARWRKAGRPEALASLQREILEAGASALKPGGTLVYSTCTISPIENERVVAAFLAAHEDFAATDLGADLPLWKHPTMPQYLQTFPHRDRTDGFFVARLRRRA